MVLQIRSSAVDRGACVRDYSQYMEEVEYLWVPGSFLEQVIQSLKMSVGSILSMVDDTSL